MHFHQLNKALGNVDIYLLDQILKGRFEGTGKLLDAGCGEGRNLNYFINNGYEVYGCDTNPMAIKMAQMTFKNVSRENFKNAAIEDLEYPDGYFDSIICTAVLHFATGEDHFKLMLANLVRMLNKNGVLFIRMATDIGMTQFKASTFTYILPKSKIDHIVDTHGLKLIEPWKSVVVNNERSMGVFTLSKI